MAEGYRKRTIGDLAAEGRRDAAAAEAGAAAESAVDKAKLQSFTASEVKAPVNARPRKQKKDETQGAYMSYVRDWNARGRPDEFDGDKPAPAPAASKPAMPTAKAVRATEPAKDEEDDETKRVRKAVGGGSK